MTVHTNWWESFFEGVAVDMWLQAVPQEHSVREADRLEKLLGAGSGAEILDVPLPRPRVSEQVRRHAKFVDLTNYIWESLKRAMENHH